MLQGRRSHLGSPGFSPALVGRQTQFRNDAFASRRRRNWNRLTEKSLPYLRPSPATSVLLGRATTGEMPMGQNCAGAAWRALSCGFGLARRARPATVGIFLLSAVAGSLCAAAQPIPATSPFTGSTADPGGQLHVIDPFLLGVHGKALADLHLQQLLPKISDWSTVGAEGLEADNASAAVVIFRTRSAEDVTFRTDNGTSLLPYADNFLAEPPQSGSQTLRVPASHLLKIASYFYAAALVQAPGLGVGRSFATPVTVTARQGTQSTKRGMPLVPPPLVLVHGLWGNDQSLEYLQDVLTTSPPWKTRPGLVQAIAYTNDISFDAYEPASALANEIRTLLEAGAHSLDAEHIVGGRVDIIAHSMGGLVARHYATLTLYRSLRDRGQGQFHEIVTLDTPEAGSQLATYLYDHRGCSLQSTSSVTAALVWSAACEPPTLTVEQCFATSRVGMPLGPPGHLKDGAVYALEPDSPSFRRLTTGADIDGAIWRAVSAVAYSDSLLKFELNGLIDASANLSQATIRDCPPSPSLPSVDSILYGANDAIVRLLSQHKSAGSGQFATFHGLAHAPANPLGLTLDPNGSNANIVHSRAVAELATCWLGNDGDPSCNPKPGAALAAAPEFDMPQLHKVDRLIIRPPANLRLGTPFDLAIDLSSPSPLRRLVVSEEDDLGHRIAQTLPTTGVAGPTLHAEVTPMLFGSITLTVDALFDDGGVDWKDATVPVQPPTAAPEMFVGDVNSPKLGIVLDSEEGVNAYVLHPKAIYASTPDRIDAAGMAHSNPVNLDGRVVHYSVVPSGGAPVIDLQTNAYDYDPSVVSIVALRPGTATIEARFGSAVDFLRVIAAPAGD
jgi:pimeloyl-ACP methyl ester carboxylesterase